MSGKVLTVPTGHVGWKVSFTLPQHPSAGGQLRGTASSLLLFSLVYSANTELGAEMGAKADCFLPWFPFSWESISITELLLLPGGSHTALLGALVSQWETVVSDLNFNSNLNLGGKGCLLEHEYSLFHTPPVPAALCMHAQSCLTLCNPVDSSPTGSSAHGIPQARILEWVGISSSRGYFQPSNQTRFSCVSCIGRRILYHWATWEALSTAKCENRPHCGHKTVLSTLACTLASPGKL